MKNIPKIKKEISSFLGTKSLNMNKKALKVIGCVPLLISPQMSQANYGIEINGVLGSYLSGVPVNIGGTYTCPAVSVVVNGHFSRAATSGTSNITMTPVSHSSHGSHGQW